MTWFSFLLVLVVQEAAPLREPQVPPASINPALERFSVTRLGPGDVVEIQVLESQEMSRQVRVSTAGTIQLPLIGEFLAAGLTTTQLAAKISSLLNVEYLRNPHVSVILQETSYSKVTLLGAVKEPGVFPVDGRTRLLDLLLVAGGIRTNATGTATLIRDNEPHRTLDVKSLLEAKSLEENVVLKPGDIVKVIGPGLIDILIFGEVRSPGWFQVDENTTLLKVVSLAGGASDRAAKGKVRIYRSKAGKEEEVIKVDLEDVIKGKSEDIVLQDGDRIVVPKTFF